MEHHPDNEFDQLLHGCRGRDRISQKRLYELYYPYGMSVALRYASDHEEAVEVLNDGFLKVFRNLDRFDATKPFKPWFRKILINTALTHIKKKERHLAWDDMEKEQPIASPEEILSNISYQELMKMVQSLSTAYRTVFNLHVIDGYKHEEIAEQLGITVGTSKSNLAKARMKLQELVMLYLNSKYA